MKNQKYETRVTQLTFSPVGKKIYSELATQITLVDEGGGDFVSVTQSTNDGRGCVQITPDEWPELRAAIDRMIGECRR